VLQTIIAKLKEEKYEEKFFIVRVIKELINQEPYRYIDITRVNRLVNLNPDL
jgi:hypothetical protein